ncbi:MAG TPA: hypothetical protein DCG89_09330 [Spartobacteria bacterium]|jgi:hypothetical protein|nr:hypothetical protein [Spartobacteria bacterium]
MSEAIISVENLGKKYRLRHERERYTALRDVIADKAKSFFKKLKTEWSERGERHRRQSYEGSSERAREPSEFQKLKSGNGADVSESQRLSVSSKEDFWALRLRRLLNKSARANLAIVSTPTEIESAIAGLPTVQLLEVAAWLDDYRAMIQSSESLFERLDAEGAELAGQQWLGE